MRCPQCGYVQGRSEECVRCGRTLARFRPRPSINNGTSGNESGKHLLSTPLYIPSCPASQDKKDPKAAAWLNFFFPGVGYMYSGRIFFGISLLLIFLSCALGTMLGIYALMPVSIGMSIVSILDSYRSKIKHNRAVNGQLSRGSSRPDALQAEDLDADSPRF
jgi:TM2 domain-containing membrane protein YozV